MAKLQRAATGNKPAGKSRRATAPTKDAGKVAETSQGDNLPASGRKGIRTEDLVAYRLKNLTYQEIATLTGTTKQNVCERIGELDLESLVNYRDNKDSILELKQREIIDLLDSAKLKTMSAGSMVTAIAILQDKIMDIRGQSDRAAKPMIVIQVAGQAQVNMVGNSPILPQVIEGANSPHQEAK